MLHLIICGNRLYATVTVRCYLAQRYSNYLQFKYRKAPNIFIHTLFITQIVILTY